MSVFVIFFACKRYKQKKNVVSGSRENFLSRDGAVSGVSSWRPPLDDEEFESGYEHRRMQSVTGVTMEGDGMMQQLPAGPISYPSYPYDGDDRGENAGGRSGGFSGNVSAESAMMYPIRQQSEPEYWPDVTQIGLALPYQNPEELANRSVSDPFGDDHVATDAGISTSMTGHGHASNDALASSVFLGNSSSQAHLIGATGAQTSSSGHGIGDGGRTSKSPSPVAERNRFPPSSYVPPGRPRTGSDGSGGGSGNTNDNSSIKGLFGKLKSISRDMMERNKRSSLQHQDSRGPGLSRSSGESVTSRPSMSMSLGHSSGPGHTSLTSHHGHDYPYYGMPSSLLNPPKPIPMAMPNYTPPVPIIRRSEPTLIAQPYLISNNYPLPLSQDNIGHGFELTSDSPYIDTWTPPTIFCSSPSPVPTDASSYVEGLLNPHILPGTSGGLGVPNSGITGGSGTNGSIRGYGLGMSQDGGESVMSLRDNVDYSRPISKAVTYRSTTTFGTDIESASIALGDTRSIGAEKDKRSI